MKKTIILLCVLFISNCGMTPLIKTNAKINNQSLEYTYNQNKEVFIKLLEEIVNENCNIRFENEKNTGFKLYYEKNDCIFDFFGFDPSIHDAYSFFGKKRDTELEAKYSISVEASEDNKCKVILKEKEYYLKVQSFITYFPNIEWQPQYYFSKRKIKSKNWYAFLALKYFEERLSWNETDKLLNEASINKYDNKDLAINNCKIILKQDTDNIEALKVLGSIYFDKKEYSEARPIYEKLLKIDEKDDYNFIRMAVIYHYLRLKTKAIEVYELGLKLYPNHKYLKTKLEELKKSETNYLGEEFIE